MMQQDSSISNFKHIFKKKKATAISAIISIVLIAFGVVFLSNATKRSDGDFKYRPFFDEQTEYDVLFFGTSHVINGIFPMQLWKDYGITSYNFGGHSNSIAASYWVMKGATEFHKPKIAVLDVLGASSQSTGMKIEYSHISFDAFPISRTKIEAVNDIFPDNPGYREELLWPFSIYHNRWDDIHSDSILQGFGVYAKTKEKGAESRINIAKSYEMASVSQSEYMKENSVGLEYIQKFIDYCKDNGIEPVIINLPYPTDENSLKWSNAAIKLAKDQNVKAIDFQYTDTVDFDIDLYDSNSHLNPSGARKITDYIGTFLTQNFEIEDKRNDTSYSQWDADYLEYKDFLVKNIRDKDDFDIVLMLLNNSNFGANLFYTKGIESNYRSKKLLNQLDGNIDLIKKSNILDEESEKADICIEIYDKENGNNILSKYYIIDDTPIFVSKSKE